MFFTFMLMPRFTTQLCQAVFFHLKSVCSRNNRNTVSVFVFPKVLRRVGCNDAVHIPSCTSFPKGCHWAPSAMFVAFYDHQVVGIFIVASCNDRVIRVVGIRSSPNIRALLVDISGLLCLGFEKSSNSNISRQGPHRKLWYDQIWFRDHSKCVIQALRPSSLLGAIFDATNLALSFHIEEVSVAHLHGVLVDNMHEVLLRPKDLVFHTCFRGPNLSIFWS